MEKSLQIFILIFMITTIIAIVALIIVLKNKKRKIEELEWENEDIKKKAYCKKTSLMTRSEKILFNKIQEAIKGTNLIVLPQINLATIIHKSSLKRPELFRNIDFGIFQNNTFEPLCLIELNDKSHEEPERIARDINVKKILEACNLPLITLYTNQNNEPKYIKKRIYDCLKFLQNKN